METRGNRGECGEIYAKLKILSEGRINLADSNLNPRPGNWIDVTSITSVVHGQRITHRINREKRRVDVYDHSGRLLFSIGINKLARMAEELLQLISESKGTFAVPREILDALCSQKIQAGCRTKTDLIIGTWDGLANREREIGFSIKSMMGNPATILNPSGATKFNFIADGLTDDAVEKINAISSRSKILDRAAEIVRLGGSLHYLGMASDIFERNCSMVCVSTPNMLGEMLRLRYGGAGRGMVELTAAVAKHGRFGDGVVLDTESCVYKMKHFLGAVTLGMNPSTPWDGRCEVIGGCIIVKAGGDLVCYHADNRDELNTYLFNNTGLDTPDPKKFNFGKIYRVGSENRLDYVLQIRFLR